jgi:hypothetical protein
MHDLWPAWRDRLLKRESFLCACLFPASLVPAYVLIAMSHCSQLVLVKHGKLDLLLQKRICAAINIWIRGPSLVLASFILFLNYRYGTGTEIAMLPLLIVMILTAWNGQYYTKQSVANYAITHCIGHVKERISVTTGTAVPDWRKMASSPRCKQPQNTMS